MATQVITVLTDDLDGTDADRTVEFGLDGVNYTIDLSDKNAGKLRKALDPYITAGHRESRNGRRSRRIPDPHRHGGRPVQSGTEPGDPLVGGENGYGMSERGRIPALVVDAFHQSR